MATNNIINTPLSGSTGTGNFVGADTPTLITPVLGAATATSINFGGSTLSNYVSNTAWTPVFTFATPGNLSVVYSTQLGYYTRIGSVVYISFFLSITPTYTTSSGIATITGLPFTGTLVTQRGSLFFTNGNVSYGAGNTQVNCSLASGSSSITLSSCGPGVGGISLGATNFTSAGLVSFSGQLFIFV